MPANMAADCVVSLDQRVLDEGAIPVRIFCDPPHPRLEVEGDISAGITIRAGKGASGANLKLRGLCTTAADVIRKLTNAVGRQDEPINLSVWTAKDEPLV
jgi:hypothetical protein